MMQHFYVLYPKTAVQVSFVDAVVRRGVRLYINKRRCRTRETDGSCEVYNICSHSFVVSVLLLMEDVVSPDWRVDYQVQEETRYKSNATVYREREEVL